MRVQHVVPLLIVTLAGSCSNSGNGALAPAFLKSAHRFALSGDLSEDERVELFVGDYTGALHKVSGALAVGGSVTSWKWSPDQRHIAFIADQFSDGFFELFVVEANTGVRTKINPTLAPGGSVGSFQWSPNGSQLAYTANDVTTASFDLLVSGALGQNTVRVSPALPAAQNVTDFAWSPNGAQLVYRADQDTAGQFELYVAPYDASTAAIKVSGLLGAGADVLGGTPGFAWSKDGARIAYLADQDTPGTLELYSVLPTGLSNTKINGLLVAGGNVGTFEWSPLSTRIAYIADEDTDGIVELYASNADGTNNVKLSRALTPGGFVNAFDFDPTGTRVAYTASAVVPNVFELFTVLPDGTGDVQVNGTPQHIGVGEFAWSPNGSRLAYSSYQDSAIQRELYATGAASGPSVKISGVFQFLGNVQEFRWSLNSAYVAYRADQDTQGSLDLYVTSPFGAVARRVCGPNTSGGSVTSSYQWAPDGVSLFFTSDQSVFGHTELYVTGVSGGARIVSGPSQGGSNIVDFGFP